MKAFQLRMTAIVFAIAGVAGCAYQGGDIGDPVTRKFHWFSYVEGEDIKSTCQPGTPDRTRLVYNGIYEEQLRMYELDGLRRLLTVRVVDQGNGARFSAEDLSGPWRAEEKTVPLDEPTYGRLVAAFTASAMFAPPPVGLDLPSHSYYWTAATCKDGRYGFTAWKYPSPAFDAIAFAQPLFALDPTGVPVNAAKPLRVDPQWQDMAKRHEVTTFTLTVGKAGLVH